MKNKKTVNRMNSQMMFLFLHLSTSSSKITYATLLFLFSFMPYVSCHAQVTTSDISYGTDSLEKFDIYAARGINRPIIILLHAGGWAYGDKSELAWQQTAQMFQDSGFAVINTNYVLSHETNYRGFPSQPKNIACVVAWAKNNASMIHGDTSNIILFGFSAGAHLASLVGLWNEDTLLSSCDLHSSLQVKGVIGLSGVYDLDLTPINNRVPIREMLRDSIHRWNLAKPQLHIDNTTSTSFLILHGTKDLIAGNEQPYPFYDSLISKGYCARMHIFLGRSHGDLFDTPLTDTALFNIVFPFIDSLTNNRLCGEASAITDLSLPDLSYQIFPNPATQQVHVVVNTAASVRLSISNSLGELFFDEQIDKHTQIDVQNWVRGCYIAMIKVNGQVYRKKLIIN